MWLCKLQLDLLLRQKIIYAKEDGKLEQKAKVRVEEDEAVVTICRSCLSKFCHEYSLTYTEWVCYTCQVKRHHYLKMTME